MDTSTLQQMDREHFLHPFTDTRALAREGVRVITRAEGVYLWDSDGNKILDGMAGLWCVNVGYGRQELVDAATRQLQELPFYNSFFKTANPPAIELSKLLAEVTAEQFNYVFYTGSGSESNDTNIRLLRRYWDLMGKPGKSIIISRVNSYHGSTIAAASLGGQKPMHEQGHLPIPGIVHIGQPYWYRTGDGMAQEAFGLQAAKELETRIIELGADNVAAFIGEPVQGAGGVIIPPDSYWPEIERICRKHDVLLVADEVICGMGRTGKWFGSDYFGFKPDLMTVAKGLTSGYLPLGACIVSDRIADVIIEKGGEFAHGFTYSGHPACCAVAIANLKLLQSEGIIDNVAENTGPYLQQCWQQLGEHPLVGEARGAGFLGALELVRDKDKREFFEPAGDAGSLCRDHCFNNGLIMRAVGDTMIISPPLIMNRDEIDELVETANTCLDLTAKDLGMC